MGDDEIATVETITEYRETITSLVTQWKGRVVDSPGDNILAEFGSVVDAVQCAVEIQHILKAKNEELPENRRMIFRIGVNLGDVIQEGDRIYGDGVNIAARIESLADGGGICISGTAYDQIKNKLALGYNYFGEHSVKNISEPVRVYKVPMEPGERKEKKRRIKRWQWVAAAVLVLILAGAAFWNFYLRSSLPSIEPASVEKMAFPLPDKPSIAVLPFTNMSGDPKQEYLADGISENVISALSHVPELFVIARQSTFTYKGKPVKIQQVAEELGVRYVLEGSVQRSGDTLRITAQLIDAITGHHLWSDRYDRKLKNIFALQDEITLNILQALEVKLTANEQYITFRKGTDNLEAYLKMLEAREYSGRSNKEGYAMAGKLAEEAITLDPDYPGPYLMLSAAHLMEISFGTSKLPKQSLKMAEKLVLKALALDDHLAEGYAFLGRIYLTKRQYDKALTAGEKACELAPNSSFVHAALGYSLHNAGRPEEAITHLKKAIRLSPFPRAWYLGTLGGAYYMLGRYEEAIAEFKKGLQLAPKSVFPRLGLAAAYSELGREEHARVEAAEVLSLDPKFTLVSHAKGRLSKNKDYTERYMAALRKAGLPDKPPLPLPDKPSIAVLPFANISGDPKEDYLSDGITEQIITALSKTPKLFVIARNSVFTYKGKPVMVQQVSDELGVRYVLEGSVQKSGDRIRITAQLIDAKTGNHLWAEKFDRDLKDIFAIQDEITKKIITSVHVKLTEGEQGRLYAKGTANLDAYLKASEASWYLRQSTKEGLLKAKQLAEDAIALDPNYPSAYSTLGMFYGISIWLGMSKSPTESLKRAIELSQKAIALDESFALAHVGLGYWLTMARQYDKAIAEGELAMALEPGSADVIQNYAMILTYAGRFEEAIPLFREALRLNPMPPNSYYRHFGLTLREAGHYEEAIAVTKKAIDREPNDLLAHVGMAVHYTYAGRMEEARATAKEVLRIKQNFSADQFGKVIPMKDPAVTARIVEALKQAGLK